MMKTNKIIPLDVRGTTKTATELTSQELEALQYMKKCGKLFTLRLWLYFPVNRRFYRLETVKFSLFATDLPPTK